jgi:prefoldin subunit 5
VTSLFERVTQAEAIARQQADELRAQLAAVEERLRRLAITRETLTEFADARGCSAW